MIKQFTFNHFEVNTYVVIDEQAKQCAIVDPACEASFEDSQLMQYIATEGLTPVMVLLTHAHVDHIAGLRQVCAHYKLPVSMHKEGRKLLNQAEAYGSIMGFAVDNMGDLEVVEINDNEVLKVGETEVTWHQFRTDSLQEWWQSRLPLFPLPHTRRREAGLLQLTFRRPGA